MLIVLSPPVFLSQYRFFPQRLGRYPHKREMTNRSRSESIAWVAQFVEVSPVLVGLCCSLASLVLPAHWPWYHHTRIKLRCERAFEDLPLLFLRKTAAGEVAARVAVFSW